MPEFDRESGSQRLFDFIDWLSNADWEVSFVARRGSTDDRYARLLQQRGVAVYTGSGNAVEELVTHGRFAVAIAAFWYIAEAYAPMLRSGSPGTRLLVDSVDLHFLRNARRVFGRYDGKGDGLLDDKFALRLTRELNTYVQADAVLTVSEKEARLLNDLVGGISLAHSVPDAEEWPEPRYRFEDRRGILFLGNFRHSPNLEAADFLIREILPRVDSSLLHDHPFSIVGNGAERIDWESLTASGAGQVVGWVPSVRPYLERARVSVLPLLHGAGTKRKLLQALMAGTPTVSTTIGVEGLDLEDGRHVLVADDPGRFVESLVQLLEDKALWRRLARSGRAHIASSHGADLVRSRFLDVVDWVADGTVHNPLRIRQAAERPALVDRYARLVDGVTNAVERVVPRGATVAVVSKGDESLLRLDGRTAWHFPRVADGKYAGFHPASGMEPIAMLEEARAQGAQYLVFPSTSFWWLDHYQELFRHLEERHARILGDSECVVYRLESHTLDNGGNSPAPARLGEGRQEKTRTTRATDPIIVYGAPRSGTTYLIRILNAHPEVFVTHETRLFVWAHESLKSLTESDDALLSERQRFIGHLRATYPDMIRDFYRQLGPKARYWGDKNPHYASPENQGCLDTILELFPGARFLHMVRDGRDVVTSLIRKRHDNGDPWIDFEGAHRVWTGHLDIGTDFGRLLVPEQYLELRYEELIRDDVGVARTVFEHLDIPFADEVVRFCERQQVERTPFSGPTRDLNRGARASEWGSVLTAEQQARSLDLLSPHLVRHGYGAPIPTRADGT
jgi:glycosyltransferase involved in cell wall biosynthesis